MRLLPRSGAINRFFTQSVSGRGLLKRRRSYSVSGGALSALACDEDQVFDDLPGHDSFLKFRSYPPVNCLCTLPQESRLYPFVVKLFHTLDWYAAREVRFSEAVQRYGLQHSIEVFSIIVHVFSTAGMQKEVHSLLRNVVRYYERADCDINQLFQVLLDSPTNRESSRLSINILVKVLAELSLLEHALDVYVQAKRTGLVLDVLPCNFLLKCLGETGQGDVLEALFEEMKSSGPSPNEYTYTIVINFYCKRQSKRKRQIEMMRKAHEVFEHMKKSGESPSAVTYAVYVGGLCRSGHIESAIGFILNLRNDNVPLSVSCFNAIMSEFCKKGETDEALRVFNEMKYIGISADTYSYSILIGGLCRQDRLEEALCFMKEMERQKMEIPLVTYTSMIQGFCKIGMVGFALELFRSLQDCGYKCDWVIYDVLIKGFCSVNETDNAVKLLQEMINNNVIPNVRSFNHLIRYFCNTGLLEMALRCYIIMFESGVHPTISTFNAIVNGYCKAGRLVEALYYMQEVQNHGIVALNVHHYNTIINQLSNEGYPDRAWEILTLMLKTNCVPNIVTYSIIADGYARHLDIKKTLVLYARSFKLGVPPDVVFFTIIINMFASAGRMQDAYHYFKEMIRKGLNPDTIAYTSIIAGYCKNGDMRKAWSFYKDMLERGNMPDVVTYTCLIQGFCQLNRMDMATMLHEEMKVKKIPADVQTYTVLISAHRRLGNADAVDDLVQEMEINGVYPDEFLGEVLGLDVNFIDNG